MASRELLLDSFHVDLGRLAAIPDGQLDAPVPTCPGWTVTDLLAHVGRVHHRSLGLLGGAPFVRLDAWEPTPEGPEAVAWSREVGPQLEVVLRQLDPSTPTQTWGGEAPAFFWIRRMAQETSLHRWDAERAFTTPTPIDPDIGVDGVDELLTQFLPRLPGDAWATVLAGEAAATIHVHATDAHGEWTITITPEGPTVTDEHGKGDVAVRGGGGDLDLLVWNRANPDDPGFECFGDTALLRRLLGVMHF